MVFSCCFLAGCNFGKTSVKTNRGFECTINIDVFGLKPGVYQTTAEYVGFSGDYVCTVPCTVYVASRVVSDSIKEIPGYEDHYEEGLLYGLEISLLDKIDSVYYIDSKLSLRYDETTETWWYMRNALN
jgi:hypothetical protein